MPKKGKLPKWEREDNRSKLFSTILRNPLTFTEILDKSELSRSTLTQHLKDLQKEQVIEKTILAGKVVYRPILDEEIMLKEVKRASFDGLLSLISKINLDFGRYIEVLLRILVKLTIYIKNRELIEGKKTSSDEIKAFLKNLNKSQLLPRKIDENLDQYKLKPFLETIDALNRVLKEGE